MASLLNNQCRTSDIVARYGGEEFVVLFPSTDTDGAMHLAQARTMALRQFLTDQPLPKAGNLVVVTHQVNITALTGIHPAMGESVVLERGSEGRLDVLGTLPPP